ncbi:hypothetical protein L596_023713 [Steinernema carpocapsae]|uniref:C-type lectin domain-containing protein n=1 Tax=Steinernema carpocapsae TaxID=34508 RepID=A0A4U5MEQ1_STECR|nr:hypothetical protein L596_023713 [Steinernema carpocapsae]
METMSCTCHFEIKSEDSASVPEIQSKNKYTACEFGWTSLAQNDSQNFKWCIRTFEYYSNTWDYSDSLCGHYGGHLVTLSSEKELKLLEDEVRKATNGKKDKGDFGLWVGLGQMCPKHDPKSTNLPILRWVDGRRVDPNKDKVFGRELNRTAIKDDEGTWKGRYCASINVALNDKAVKSYFSLEHCEKNLPYICIKSSMRAMSPFHVVPASKVSPNDVFNKTPKKPEGFTAEEPCGADPSWCPLTDEKNRTTCYRIVHKLEHRKRSENICEKLHGNLVSVHDDLQREFLVQMASSGVKPLTEDRSKYWIGLHQNNAERSLSWSDSSVLDYFVDLYMPNNTQEVLENI